MKTNKRAELLRAVDVANEAGRGFQHIELGSTTSMSRLMDRLDDDGAIQFRMGHQYNQFKQQGYWLTPKGQKEVIALR